MELDAKPREGRRVVIGIYVAVVAIAAVMGFAIGVIAPQGLDPELFGLVDFPRGPFGMAAYGAVTLAVILGVLLGLVQFVSRRYAD